MSFQTYFKVKSVNCKINCVKADFIPWTKFSFHERNLVGAPYPHIFRYSPSARSTMRLVRWWKYSSPDPLGKYHCGRCTARADSRTGCPPYPVAPVAPVNSSPPTASRLGSPARKQRETFLDSIQYKNKINYIYWKPLFLRIIIDNWGLSMHMSDLESTRLKMFS